MSTATRENLEKNFNGILNAGALVSLTFNDNPFAFGTIYESKDVHANGFFYVDNTGEEQEGLYKNVCTYEGIK